jgi:hypothetical protein
MKRLYKFLPIVILPVVLILFANSSGSPGGKSGSPGDSNANCTQCHSGATNSASGWISTNVPVQGYTPGQTYAITVTGTHSGVVKFGFELTAETTAGAKTGTFAITDATRTKLTNQNKAVTHKSAGTTPSGNTASWSVNWTAPATDVGQIRFYSAFNAANGNGNNSGDVIYTSNLSVNAALPESLAGITPDHADQNASVVVTINGTNTFWNGSSPVVQFRSVDNTSYTITAQSVTVQSNTSIQATFQIPSNATLGWYDVLVDDLNLNSAFYVSVLNAIADQEMNSYKMYPNPAADQITIESAVSSKWKLYDQRGQMVINQMIISGSNTVDLSQLASGIYFAQIDGSSKATKLVVR